MPKFEVKSEVANLGVVKHVIRRPDKEAAIEKFKNTQPNYVGPVIAKNLDHQDV